MTATIAVDVNAPTNVNEVVKVAEAMYKGSSIIKKRSGSVRNSELSAYL